jgi:hypothetical protein
MTVDAFITSLESKFDCSAYTDTDQVDFINAVESNVYADIIKVYGVQYYNRQINLTQFTLPTGVAFEDIKKLYVNGVRYKKYDSRAYKVNKSYWYEQGKINIYPAPTINDAQYVSGASEVTFQNTSYTSGASQITFASTTITTTGTDFSNLYVGNKIDVSGCIDQTGNNKAAVITGVAAKVLTFASGTFTAQVETGTVNIATNAIYTSGTHFSGFAVGDVALVSGCLLTTTNNKYGVITDVQDHVLTFASGTFGAQAETAAITVKAPKIKVTYDVKPTAKTVAGITTETLILPDRFVDVYRFYNIAQMSLYDKDFKIYNNYIALYNQKLADFERWWEERRPITPEEELVASEEEYYNSDVDFDSEV